MGTVVACLLRSISLRTDTLNDESLKHDNYVGQTLRILQLRKFRGKYIVTKSGGMQSIHKRYKALDNKACQFFEYRGKNENISVLFVP